MAVARRAGTRPEVIATSPNNPVAATPVQTSVGVRRPAEKKRTGLIRYALGARNAIRKPISLDPRVTRNVITP